METAYVYKITFEEVPHFYIGVRRHNNPENDGYLGSPSTHKVYWEIYTPKKQIMWVFDSWDQAFKVEQNLIKSNWKSKYCLNENVRGCGPRSGFALAEARKADKELDKKIVGTLRENWEKFTKRRSENPELYEKCRKASEKNVKVCNRKVEQRRKEDPQFNAEFLERVRKQGKMRWKCLVTGFISNAPGLSIYQRARGIDTSMRERIDL